MVVSLLTMIGNVEFEFDVWPVVKGKESATLNTVLTFSSQAFRATLCIRGT